MSHLYHPEGNDLPDYEWSRVFGQAQYTNFDFQLLADALDCERGFYGAGIIYNDGLHSYLVRPSQRMAAPGLSRVTHVVVTNVAHPSREAAAKSLKAAVTERAIGAEIAATALSCGAIILTIAACFYSAGAIPLTAGLSTPLAVMAAAGTAATAIQCVNGIVRLYDIERNDGRNVDWVDTQGWYQATMTALDLISLMSIVGPLKEVVNTYKVMKLSSSMKFLDWLKRVPRTERVRITQGIIKQMNPGISNKQIKAMILAGKYPRRFPSEAIQGELVKQLINAITNTMAVAGSAVSGVIRSPESIINSGEYVFGILQSVDTIN